jgi:hypothetical protein
MSRWRREASERLPDLQSIIASKLVDNPMMLWIELNQKFEKLSAQQPLPLDLLKRIWGYCEWCLVHGGDDVRTAAALAFCEHLIDSPQRAEVLPRIMKRSDFLDLRNLLEYHNSPAEIDACLKSLWG